MYFCQGGSVAEGLGALVFESDRRVAVAALVLTSYVSFPK